MCGPSPFAALLLRSGARSRHRLLLTGRACSRPFSVAVPHLLPLLVRGINNLSDARYCAGMGADKLTCVLDPGLPGFLDTKTVKELAGWVAGVELIGEFDQLSAYEINAISAECQLDAVLLRTPRTAEELAEIAPPVYLELPATHEALAQALPDALAGVVVELPENVAEATLASLSRLGNRQPLWVGPGLRPELALHLARKLTLAGLVLPSGHEVQPGLRDFDQLEAVFEALETDD